METFRCILAALAGAFWLLATICNYRALYVGLRKQQHVSPIPLFGTLAGLACLALLPVGSITIRLLFFPLAMACDPQVWYAIGYFLIRGIPKG